MAWDWDSPICHPSVQWVKSLMGKRGGAQFEIQFILYLYFSLFFCLDNILSFIYFFIFVLFQFIATSRFPDERGEAECLTAANAQFTAHFLFRHAKKKERQRAVLLDSLCVRAL
jgi:hypothetical protein